MVKKIAGFLKDLLARSPLTADRPYISQPPEQKQDGLPAGEEKSFYEETSIETGKVAGISLEFGSAEQIMVDEDGNSTRIRQAKGHILGSGRLVSSLHPTNEDGNHRPGVGGVCYACNFEAAQLLQVGLIDIQEAQRRSLFDTDSAAQCDACGRRDLCIRHCRPFDKTDGTRMSLCPGCTQKAERERNFQLALGILLSPFADQKQLPSARIGEEHNGQS
jgi:hypothetical protein